jgi:hypothetical protein
MARQSKIKGLDSFIRVLQSVMEMFLYFIVVLNNSSLLGAKVVVKPTKGHVFVATTTDFLGYVEV